MLLVLVKILLYSLDTIIYNFISFHIFVPFFGFSLIMTKYIGGIYLTISDFLQTLKHRNFTFLFKGT